jgi:hypothetical protein
MVVGLALAGILGSITTVSWVMLGDVALGTLILAVIAHRRAGIPANQHWRTLRPILIGCAAAWPAARLVADALGHDPATVALAASTAAGLLVYVAIVWLIAPEMLRAAVNGLRRILRRSPPAAAAAS